MSEASKSDPAKAARVRCSACGSEQDAPPANQPGRCLVCSKPLFGPMSEPEDETADLVLDLSEPETPPVPKPSLAAAAAALPREAPSAVPAAVSEIQRADKLLVSCLAFVPLWGPWRLRRSESHSPSERTTLTAASLLMTAVIAIGVSLLLPSAETRRADTQRKIDGQIAVLRVLADEYRKQYGQYPDAETWKRSAEHGDLRFYDPWNRLYVYRPAGDGYSIGTYGADGSPGGKLEDTDVFVQQGRASSPG